MNSFTLRIGRNVSLVKVWALVCLVKSFFRILRENSVLLRALRGHFIREQHCCLHLILWCLIHRKRCYASPPSNIRLENSLKLEWCPGVQRSEQTSWTKVSKLSKVHFDLPFLDLNWKCPASLRLELSLKNSSFSSEFRRGSSLLLAWTYLTLVPLSGWETFTPIIS